MDLPKSSNNYKGRSDWIFMLVIFCPVCVSLVSPTGFYADNELQQTVLISRLPGRDKRVIKQEILTLLGLHHRPRPTAHGTDDSAPSYMMNLYNTLQNEDEEDEDEMRRPRRKLADLKLAMPGMEKSIEDADTIMSFINHAKEKHRVRHEPNKCFYFDFSEVSPEELVIGAEIRMYKNYPEQWNVGNSSYTIKLYRVIHHVHGYDLAEKTLELEVTTAISGTYEGWIDANVTAAAATWTRTPHSNLGLYMKIVDKDGVEVDPVVIGMVDRKGPEGLQPFLVAFFKSNPNIHSRSRRSTQKQQNRKTEVTYSDEPYDGGYSLSNFNGRSCQRRTLYVSFRDLGWQYSSIDSSPFSQYVTHPFWNWLVEYLPVWIAPNTLTLVGALFLVLQFALLSNYDYSFYASADNVPSHPPVPAWVWAMSGFCMFMAHTLDGLDGKQARRTKTSSPLGELFDHGLDSWASSFMPIAMYSTFGRGDYSLDVNRVYFIIIGVMTTFIISHWEKYNTGVLFLPWGYDISQVAMTLIYFATAAGGHTIWKFTIPIVNITSGQFFEIVMLFAVLGFSVPMSLWNVYVSYRDRTGKMRTMYEAIRPLIPATVLFGCFITWMYCSSTDIVRKEPRLFLFATGTVFSNIACRLIVSGMSNTRCEVFSWLLIPLVFITTGVCTLNLGILEIYLLWAYTIFATAAHIQYGICVVQQFADHLNIYAFSTKRPPRRE